jgi:hypothetical protein
LQVIEMSIVTPPFVLDFAKASLDRPVDFTQEALDLWREEKREQFGERWDEVVRIMSWLSRELGVYLHDVNPYNITFARPHTA